jgi:uncharacterized protein YjbI with pentapeptide repeats
MIYSKHLFFILAATSNLFSSSNGRDTSIKNAHILVLAKIESDSTKKLNNWAGLFETGNCEGCDLIGLDLRGIYLFQANLRDAIMTGTKVSGYIEESDMRGAIGIGPEIYDNVILENTELDDGIVIRASFGF